MRIIFASSFFFRHMYRSTNLVNVYMPYFILLQVSKTEKFGYGSMVTQVAATAPGIVALQRTGTWSTPILCTCHQSRLDSSLPSTNLVLSLSSNPVAIASLALCRGNCSGYAIDPKFVLAGL